MMREGTVRARKEVQWRGRRGEQREGRGKGCEGSEGAGGGGGVREGEHDKI